MATIRRVGPGPCDARRSAGPGEASDPGRPEGAFAIEPDPLTIDLVIDAAGLDAATAMHALIRLGPRLATLAPRTPTGRGPIRPDVMELDTDAVLVRFSSSSAMPDAAWTPTHLPSEIVRDLERLLVDLGLGEDATCLVRIAGLGHASRTHRVAVPGRLDRALVSGAPRSRG